MKGNIWILLLLVMLLTACGIDRNEYTEKQNTEVIIEVGELKEERLDLEKYSVENLGTTCGQPEYISNVAASSDLGIYYWGERSQNKGSLMFYDKASKVSVVLCNRPNCNHTDNSCNAAFNGYSSDGEEFYRNMVFYYDDSVFLVGHDENHYVNLYKVEADGSSWEKYMTLFKAEMAVTIEDGGTSMSWSLPDVCIHQNYVYYIDNSESEQKLRRIPLGGGETEVLIEPEGDRTLVYRMMPYGDYIFVQAGKYEGEGVVAGIYAYNIQTEEIILVKADALQGYFVVDEQLYYESNEKIYKFDLKTGTEVELSIVYELGINFFFVDEYGIYIFNRSTGTLSLYDETGELLGRVTDENMWDCSFGMDGIFYGGTKLNGQKVILEVEELLNGSGKWSSIP